jgi:hypothetical protein
MWTVIRIAQVRTMERSSVRAASISAAVSLRERDRNCRGPAKRSWACAPAIERAISAGSVADVGR